MKNSSKRTKWSLSLLFLHISLAAILTAAFLAALAPHRSFAEPLDQPVTQKECAEKAERIKAMIKRFTADGRRRAIYDPLGFRVGIWGEEARTWPPSRIIANTKELLDYYKIEDGAIKTIRTGHEVALYNKIKNFIATRQGQMLGQQELMEMGLDAVADGQGNANIQTAALTVHNVIRVLARPKQWVGGLTMDEYAPRDAMLPIFNDLLGKSSTGGKSLAEITGQRLNRGGEVYLPAWSLETLFNTENGAFRATPGARIPPDANTRSEWNGGNHYYYWIGLSARTSFGDEDANAIIIGALIGELSAKKAAGRGRQGEVEVSMFVCGSILGSELSKNRDDLNADDKAICETVKKDLGVVFAQIRKLQSWTKNMAAKAIELRERLDRIGDNYRQAQRSARDAKKAAGQVIDAKQKMETLALEVCQNAETIKDAGSAADQARKAMEKAWKELSMLKNDAAKAFRTASEEAKKARTVFEKYQFFADDLTNAMAELDELTRQRVLLERVHSGLKIRCRECDPALVAEIDALDPDLTDLTMDHLGLLSTLNGADPNSLDETLIAEMEEYAKDARASADTAEVYFEALLDLAASARKCLDVARKKTGTGPPSSDPEKVKEYYILRISGSGFIPHYSGASYVKVGHKDIPVIIDTKKGVTYAETFEKIRSDWQDAPPNCSNAISDRLALSEGPPRFWDNGPNLEKAAGPLTKEEFENRTLTEEWRRNSSDGPNFTELKKRFCGGEGESPNEGAERPGKPVTPGQPGMPSQPGTLGEPIDPDALDPNSPDVGALVRKWISIAKPPENAVEGANWRYDKFGRMVGSGPGMRTVRTHETVDYGGGTPEASAWSLRKELDSINHCTMEEYVVAKLEQNSISHCAGRYGAVKDLKGMRLGKAKAAVTNAGFKYSLAPGKPAKTLAQEGTIERQEPGPEQYLKKGQTVVLSVHAPYVPAVLVIPDFRGKPLADARNWLRENELKADLKAGRPAPTSDKSGMVASQDPAPGTKLKQGKGVKLEVYGPYNPKVAVPDVTELSVKDAKARLEAKGLKAHLVASGTAPSSGLSLKVKESEPKAGAKVSPGTEVTVKVYGKYSQPFVAVPKVAGLSFSNAKARLVQAGLKASAKSAGPAPSKAKSSRIKSQEPVAGEKVNPGSEVKVYVFSKYIPADPNERIEEREQVQAWVLVDTLVNPQNKPTEFIVGVTPNYYSPRYQGSFDKYKVKETYITYKKYHVDREVLKANIEIRADFTKPPKTLVPGEIISLMAKISANGTSPGIGTDVWFKYRAKGINLKGDTFTNTGTNSKPPYRTNSISSYFIVPKIHKGTIEIYASLNCGACDVRWIYRAQEVDQGVEAREVPRKPTPEEQVANADCSKYPGSRAYWDKAAGKPKCGCFDGLKWNLSKTRCVSSETHADEICARDYPGSVAKGRTADGTINCDCPQGTVWNTDRTRCVQQASPQELCTRNYPGSVPGGRDASGKIICNCPQGNVWTADKSRCVKKHSGGGKRRKKSTCHEMAGRWKNEGNVVEFTTRDGVNYEGRFTAVSSHWQRFGYRTGELAYRVRKTSKTNWKGQALIRYSNGTSKWVRLIISAHGRCGYTQFHVQGQAVYQNWKRKR